MNVVPAEHKGPGEKIMVIVAHPDDAEFMSAGSVAAWTKAGKEVVYVLVTSGDKGTEDPDIIPSELAAQREIEQRNVCDILGVTDIEFLRHEDGTVTSDLRLRKDIVRAIRKHKPSAVITQNPTVRWSGNYVNHPDHRATGDAAMDAVFPSARDVHMFPELKMNEGLEPHIVPHLYLGDRTEDSDVTFDITESFDTKAKALAAHVSQVPNPEQTAKFLREGAALVGARAGFKLGESFKYFWLGKD
jgi:LmbE family N-acetylglucosaminyl deacetylase